MDWMTFTTNVLKFISDLVGALAWPVVSVWLIWRFRLEIAPLIAKLSALKFGAVEAKFALDTERALIDIETAPAISNQVAAQTSAVEQPDIPSTQVPEIEVGNAYRIQDDWYAGLELQNLDDDESGLRNSALVAMSWRDIEGAVARLVLALGPRIEYEAHTISSKLKALERIGVLAPRFLQALRSLQKLRNEVLHTPGFEPTDESTKSYLEGVRSARLVLREAIKDAQTWG